MAERKQQSKVHPKPLGSPRWVRVSPDQVEICIITRAGAYLNMNSNQLTSSHPWEKGLTKKNNKLGMKYRVATINIIFIVI